jgi:hypothetical protein
MSVFFHPDTKGILRGWYVKTDFAYEATEDMHSLHKYSSSELGDVFNFKIEGGTAPKHPGLGT